MSAQNSIYQLLATGEADSFNLTCHVDQQKELFWSARLTCFEPVAGQVIQAKSYRSGKSPEAACFSCLQHHTKRRKMMAIARESNQRLVADVLFGKAGTKKTRLIRVS